MINENRSLTTSAHNPPMVMYIRVTTPAMAIPMPTDIPGNTLSNIPIAAHLAPISNSLTMTPLHAITCWVERLYRVARYSVGDWIPVLDLNLDHRGAIRKVVPTIARLIPTAHHI